MVSDVTDFYQDCPATSISGELFLLSMKWVQAINGFIILLQCFFFFRNTLYIHIVAENLHRGNTYDIANNGRQICNGVFLSTIQYDYTDVTSSDINQYSDDWKWFESILFRLDMLVQTEHKLWRHLMYFEEIDFHAIKYI